MWSRIAMPFVTVANVTGKIYVPERSFQNPCKHPCPDCFSCQFCSDDRCGVCRGSAAKLEKKKSSPAAMGVKRCTAAPQGK
jgi:hypothetical protein